MLNSRPQVGAESVAVEQGSCSQKVFWNRSSAVSLLTCHPSAYLCPCFKTLAPPLHSAVRTVCAPASHTAGRRGHRQSVKEELLGEAEQGFRARRPHHVAGASALVIQVVPEAALVCSLCLRSKQGNVCVGRFSSGHGGWLPLEVDRLMVDGHPDKCGQRPGTHFHVWGLPSKNS